MSTTTTTAAYCAHCGAKLGDGSYCPGCGTPAPGARNGETTQVLDPPQGANSTSSTRKPVNRGLWIAVLIVGVLVMVGAALGILGVFSSSGPSYSSKVATAFAPLIDQNRLLSNSLTGLPGSRRQAKANVQNAQKQATLTRGQFAALGANGSALSRDTRSALDTEDSYLAAVKAALNNPQAPGTSQLQGLEGALKASLNTISPPLTDAAGAVSGTDKLVAWASHTVKAQGRNHSLRAFASSVDSILQRSAPSKSEISQLFTQMQTGDITVNQAQSGLGDVIANRSGLSGAARALDAPTGQAKQVKQALASAFDASLTDDRAIQNCLNEGLDTGIEVLFQDCLSSTSSEAGQATNSKQQFTDLYNRLRRKLRLPASNVVF